MTRRMIATLALGLTLASAAPVLATPAQAREIQRLRAQVARDNRTIRRDNATIRHDAAMIKRDAALIASQPAIAAPITTPAAAWTEIAKLAPLFTPWASQTFDCGENYAVLPTLFVAPGVSTYSSYTFNQNVITGQPWCP